MKINCIGRHLLRKHNLPTKTSNAIKFSDSNDVYVKNTKDISFGYSFDLKRPKGIPCAYCGKPTVVQEDIIRLTKLKGKELIDEIESITSNDSIVLTALNLAEISTIKNIILQYPNLDAKDIMPIVYVKCRDKMIQKQLAIYDELEVLTKTLNCPELDNYIEQVKKQDLIINQDISLEELTDFLKNKSHIEFRKDVISNIIKLSGKYITNETVDTWASAVKTISKLPSSKTDADTHLVKLISQSLRDTPNSYNFPHSSTDKAAKFYRNLFLRYLSSAEHITPHSMDGKCAPSNYLVAHTYCNMIRSSKPLFEYSSCNPEVYDNIINYLKYVSMSLKNAINLHEFRNKQYIQDVKKNLASQFYGHTDNDDVKKFLNELKNIYWLTDSNILTFYSDDVRNSSAKLFNDILSSTNCNKQYEMLDQLYLNSKKRVKESITTNINHMVNNLDSEKDKRLILILDHYLKAKCVDTLFDISNQDLNNMLSDSFISNYRSVLFNIIKKLLGKDCDKYSDKYLQKVARQISIKKTPDVYCLKILLTAKEKCGKYNIPMIIKILKSKSIIPQYVKYQHQGHSN